MLRILLFLIILILYSCKEEHNTKNLKYSNNANHEKAVKFRDGEVSDSAFYYFNLAKDEYLSNNDSIKAAQTTINMAIIQCDHGDYFGAIETSLEADTMLANRKDSVSKSFLAANYNNLAIASNKLRNFDDAEKFYKLALINVTNLENKYIYYNNIGDVLTQKGNFKSALRNLDVALHIKDSMSYARALNNWAYAKHFENKSFNPIPFYLKALKIRKKDGNKYGLNSSYANLCDYYYQKAPNISLQFAKEMEKSAIATNSSSDLLEAIKRLILLDKHNYIKNFKNYNDLSEEIQLKSNRAKNQYALIRYGVEKSKAENNILKVDKLEAQKKIIYLAIALIGLIVIIFVGRISYKRRQKRLEQEKELLEQEKELEVKNTELKYSKKVHDIVANGIYQIITKLENHLDISRNETLDDLEYVYNWSRNISYDNEVSNQYEAFNEKISKLLSYFKNDDVDTILIGNDAEIWTDVSDNKKSEAYQVLRELLINMKKHSKADRVKLKFERDASLIKVSYSDTGIGMNNETILKNGMRNMVNRIENIGGYITFGTQTEKGLEINFSFPIS